MIPHNSCWYLLSYGRFYNNIAFYNKIVNLTTSNVLSTTSCRCQPAWHDMETGLWAALFRAN